MKSRVLCLSVSLGEGRGGVGREANVPLMNGIQQKAWLQVASMVNGAALSSTLAALVQAAPSLSPDSLWRLNPGPWAVARRALEGMGWFDSAGLTSSGVALFELPEAIVLAERAWPGGCRDSARRLLERARQLPDSPLRWHLCGPPLLLELQNAEAAAEAPALFGPAAEVLGWVQNRESSPLGWAARPLFQLFEYPLSYRPLLSRAQELLLGDPEGVFTGGEEHLNRAQDVAFSGQVFSATLARPFLELLEPLFARPDPPRLMVDLGCGDGSMLLGLALELQGRGAFTSAEAPLLIASDLSPIAREIAGQTLASGGFSHLVLPGDIGNPQALVDQLRSRGLEPEGAVYVCKSVIHNRTYRGGENGRDLLTVPKGPPPCFAGAWIDHGGALLEASQVAADLVHFFRRWRPHLRRYGLVVSEAHAVPPEQVRAAGGRSLQPCLELTHGYSRQLLVPAELHRWAAREAGLELSGEVHLGAALQGHHATSVARIVAPS